MLKPKHVFLLVFTSPPIVLTAEMASCLPWKSTGASVTVRRQGTLTLPGEPALLPSGAVRSLGQSPAGPLAREAMEVGGRRAPWVGKTHREEHAEGHVVPTGTPP